MIEGIVDGDKIEFFDNMGNSVHTDYFDDSPDGMAWLKDYVKRTGYTYTHAYAVSHQNSGANKVQTGCENGASLEHRTLIEPTMHSRKPIV